MTKVTQKKNEEWEVQGNYGSGWETVSIEENETDAKEMLACYNENETQYPHRIIKTR
jgi:galactose-1-phosphate uridylyltransferase